MLPPCAEEVLDIPQAAWPDLQPHGCYQAFLLRDLAPYPSLFRFLVKYKPKITRFYNTVVLPFPTLNQSAALILALL